MALAVSCLSFPAARAATFVWTGGSGTNWSTGANWGGTAPTQGGNADLQFASANTTAVANGANPSTWSVNSVTFNSGIGSFTITSGTGVTVSIGAGGITNSDNSTQNWNVATALSANQTWTANAGGTLALSSAGTVNLNANTLKFSNTASITLAGVVSGTGGLTKDLGAGTVTLSNAANTYTGATTVNNGILSFGTLANIGTNSSIGKGNSTSTATNQASLVLNGGTLQYTGATATTNRLFTLGANGGTIDSSVASTGNLTFSNTNAIATSGGTTRTLTLTGGSNGFLASVLADDAGGATSLTKTGTGAWTLNGSATNTFTGNTTIGAGTLILNKSSGNAITGNIIIGDGTGTDTLTLGASNQINDLSALTFTNAGTPTFNLAGFSETVGSIASANTSATITLGAGFLTTGSNNASTTFAGTITGTTGGLTKTGTGNLTLSGTANTYKGATTINNGILSISTVANINSNSSIGKGDNTSTATNQASLVLNGGTLQYTGATASTNRLFTLGAGGGTIESGNSTATLTFNNTNAIATSGGTTRTLTLTGVGNGSLAAVVADGSGATSLTKAGTGTWTLANAANTYTGVTTITGGNLTFGTIANIGTNSSIGKGNSTSTATNQASLVLDGGTLRYTGATATTNRLFTLGANGGTIDASVTSSGNLTFSNTNAIATSGGTTRTLTLTGGSNGFLASVLADGAGATSLIKTGTGNWTLNGNATNTFTGDTTIGAGTLILNKSSGNAVTGNIIIGDGTGTDTLLLGAANQINDNSAISFTTGGTPIFNLNSFSETVGSIAGTNTSANITLGSATLTTGTNNASTSYAGTIDGTGGLTKTGTGNLTLAGTASTYTGPTTVTNGILSFGTVANIGTNSSIGKGNNTSTATNQASLVLDGGTLQYTGATNATNRLFTLGASGGTLDSSASSSGTLTLNNTNAIAFSGGTGARTLTLTGASNGSLAAIIGDNTGATSLTKAGAGTWTLANAANTYTGATTITGGNLTFNTIANIGTNSSIGKGNSTSTATNQASLVLDGGTLRYTGATAATNRLFTLGANGGTIDSSVSSSGTLTFNNAGAVAFSGGTGARTLTLTGGSDGFLAAIIGDNTGATSLTKNGAGTWTLNGSGNNTYTGLTTVNTGTLALNKTGGSIAVAGNISIGDGVGVDSVVLGAANQIASNSAVTFNNTIGGGITPTLNLNGYSQALGSIATTNTGAALQLGSGSTFTVGNDNTSTEFAGIISGGATSNIVKTGSGTLTLSGTNTYTGNTTVNAGGTLNLKNNNALGLGGSPKTTTIASGAALSLDNSINVSGQTTPISPTVPQVSAGTFLNIVATGTGVGGSGAIYNLTGDNHLIAEVTLGGNTTISAGNTTGAALSIGHLSPVISSKPVGNLSAITDFTNLNIGSNTLTLAGGTNNNTLQINSRITGTGDVHIDTGGLVRYYANTNTYTGTTYIDRGTLSVETLNNTYPNDPVTGNYYGVNGNIVIGDGTGAGNSATLQILSGSNYQEVLNFQKTVTLKQDGLFSLASAQSIDALTFNGGNITLTSGGSLFLNNTVTVNATANHTAYINGAGSLNLTIHNDPAPNNTTRQFTVGYDATNSATGDLSIGALILNGNYSKDGTGTMVITGDNSSGYTGTTAVTNGILRITNGGALGAGTGVDATGTTVGGTITNSGNGTNGTLQLSGGITVGNEKITLNDSGYGATVSTVGNGALQNYSGDNILNGPVSLASNARIQSESGTLLTINGAVTSSSNATLNVGGSGNTTITNSIGTGSGGIVKDGSGKLILSGSNSYSGAVAVNGTGVLSLQNSGALNGSGVTVAAGAALELDNTAHGAITTLNVPVTLNGDGIGGAGALRNVVGNVSVSANNTFSGNVTLATASRINSDAGTLTLSRDVTSTNVGLTVGGSGNTTFSSNVGLGTGALTKDGSGAASFSGGNTTVGAVTMDAGTLNFNSGNTTTGSLTINGGTTNFASANATTGGAAVNMNAGALNVTSGNLTTGQVHLLGGAASTISVSTGATLTTAEFDSAALTTLAIATGGRVDATYGAGNTTFSGKVDGVSASSFGTLALHGTTGTSQVTFNSSFESVDNVGTPTMGITLEIGGASIGKTVADGALYKPLTITLAGATTLQFYTIHITGDTILDFGNSSASVLNSANLIIDAGVKISVINWISLTDAWYATSTFTQQTSGNTTATAALYTNGNTVNPNAAPENQVTFSGFTAANTAWVSTTAGNYFEHEIRPVPEPSTYGAIFISGCVSLLGLRRYLRRRAPAAAAPRA